MDSKAILERKEGMTHELYVRKNTEVAINSSTTYYTLQELTIPFVLQGSFEGANMYHNCDNDAFVYSST